MENPVTVLRRAELSDVDAVADLHATLIHEGFLVQLGAPFLRRLYRRAVRSDNAMVSIVDDGAVRGFVAATPDTRAFYREFIARDGVPAGIAALPRIMRAPRFVFETLRYGVGDEGELPKAEILAVAVATELRGRGYGTQLVAEAVEQLSQRGTDSARVLTALGNDAALRMYEHAGFRRHGIASVHRGVDQAVLVWP